MLGMRCISYFFVRGDDTMTTPLEKSHRELYEALVRVTRMYEMIQPNVNSVIKAHKAIKNAEKIIKGER